MKKRKTQRWIWLLTVTFGCQTMNYTMTVRGANSAHTHCNTTGHVQTSVCVCVCMARAVCPTRRQVHQLPLHFSLSVSPPLPVHCPPFTPANYRHVCECERDICRSEATSSGRTASFPQRAHRTVCGFNWMLCIIRIVKCWRLQPLFHPTRCFYSHFIYFFLLRSRWRLSAGRAEVRMALCEFLFGVIFSGSVFVARVHWEPPSEAVCFAQNRADGQTSTPAAPRPALSANGSTKPACLAGAPRNARADKLE